MIPRYQPADFAALWSDEEKLRTWFLVELAAVRAWEGRGRFAAGTADTIEKKAAAIDWTAFAARAVEIEETTRHDVIAFLSALEEQIGDASKAVHFGMTSSDVVDTAFAHILARAGDLLVERTKTLREAFARRADEHRHTPCLGRTHGQAAEPTTFGLKLLTYVAELDRDIARLETAVGEVRVGKLSGAVGNFGNIPPDVEDEVMASLSLTPEPVSTQVVPRDRHAAFFAALAVVAGTLERFSVEVRHLMRSEVAEAFEPFGKGQRGSSAMPHKKNPILTENLTGLCRLVRGYAATAFENQALWHERDISHSSVERIIGPDATGLLGFALDRCQRVIEGLVVDKARMQQHLDAAGGLVFSEGVLLALVETGVLRQTAYGWVQRAAMRSRDEAGVSFFEALQQEPEVTARLDEARLTELFDVAHHVRHVDTIFARVMGPRG